MGTAACSPSLKSLQYMYVCTLDQLKSNLFQCSVWYLTRGTLLTHCGVCLHHASLNLCYFCTLKRNVWHTDTSAADRWTNKHWAGSSKRSGLLKQISNMLCAVRLDRIKRERLNWWRWVSSGKSSRSHFSFNFPSQLKLSWCSRCAYQWVIQDATL